MQARLHANVRLTTKAMWVDKGRLLERLHAAAMAAVSSQPLDCELSTIERLVADNVRRACKDFNKRSPEVVVISHEADSRCDAGHAGAGHSQGLVPLRMHLRCRVAGTPARCLRGCALC